MMKSKFFFVILHFVNKKRYMAKKKKNSKASSEKTPSSLKEALGIDKIFHNERLNFVIGFCLLFIAGYMIWAFASYFATGAADQSMIELPREGEVLNQNGEFQNACGSIGAYASWFFIKRCFGLSAFIIPLFILMVAVNLMRAYKVNLLKWFMCLVIIMVWGSVTMAKFLAPFFENACFNPGGDHGLAVCQQIEGFVGSPGLMALLAITAIAFLTYLSMETIIILRKLFNPLHYLKKIPMEINIGRGDSDEPSMEIETLEDPEVFDNPETEQIEFDLNAQDQHVAKPVKVTTEPISETDNTEVELTIDAGKKEEQADDKTLADNYGDLSTPYDPKRDLENYHYPTLDLLKKYETDGKPYIDMAEQTPTRTALSTYCATSVWRSAASKLP